MSPEEKLEMGRKLIAEAEAEIAAKKRNWPNEIKPGMLFTKWGVCYIVARIERSADLRLIGLQDGNRYSDDSLFGNSENEFAYIGLAKDLIKIADDAHEPTGAELVGKVCQFSDDGKTWTSNATLCGGYDESKGDHRYAQGRVFAWKYARLAR